MKKWMSIIFMLVLWGVAMCHIILPDAEVSNAERRKLAQIPQVTWSKVWDGLLSEQIETYLLDQFPQRDHFRQAQTLTEQYVYRMPDVNGYYQVGDGIYEIADETQEQYIAYVGNGFAGIAEQYFPNAEIYYAIIPDKNYFVALKNGYPSLDYEKIVRIVQETMQQTSSKSQYIDLMNADLLSIDDYYRTDLHWRQECIIPVAEYLGKVMEGKAFEAGEELPEREYVVKQVSDSFAGSYLGASAFAVEPDNLQSVQGEELNACTVDDYEAGHTVPMYQTDKLQGVDAYDFYMGGARALLRIENPKVDNGRTLVLFRDSFGSSIAPLLMPYYQEMIMIDLRYVSMEYCVQQIAMQSDADVLFLYNADMINHGNSLRF